MQNKLKFLMLFLGLSLEAFLQCSLQERPKQSSLLRPPLSASVYELAVYELASPLRRQPSGVAGLNPYDASPGPLTSGDASPEDLHKEKASFSNLDEQPDEVAIARLLAASTSIRIALPVPGVPASAVPVSAVSVSGGQVQPKNRVSVITLINHCDDLQSRGSVDTRVPADGRVLQYNFLKRMARQTCLYNDVPRWQSDLYDSVQKDCPEFVVKTVSDKKMHVSGDFLVGVRSWIVYAINGKANKGLFGSSCSLFENKEDVERAKNNELTARWFASATIEQTSPGVYTTGIETPALPYFAQASGTGLPSNASLCHEKTGILNSRFLQRLSPLHWIYGE